jgi:RNA 2',3'-cyclic 3'-phosphodiesterase
MMLGVRLFVAIWPPADVLDQVAALPRPSPERVRWTTPDQWHVTLRFLGNMASADPVAAALQAAGAARAVATIGPVSEVVNPAVLWLPVGGLEDLAATVIAATAGMGQPPDDHGYRGHLTLARAQGRRGRIPVLEPVHLSGSWEVSEVAVVESTLAKGGSRYTTIAQIALRSDRSHQMGHGPI